MNDVIGELRRWWSEGEAVAVATVVATHRSAPLPAGVTMLVGPGGRVVGSLSGGCVEAAIYETGQEVRESGYPRLESHRATEGGAFGIGLPCGGEIDVFVERITRRQSPQLSVLFDDIDAGRPVAMATVVEHPDPAAVGRSVIARLEDVASPEVPHPTPSLDATMLATARRLLRSGRSELRVCGSAGEPEGSTCWFFVRSLLPPPRMLVFGAVDFAAALANQGQLLGYRVTVCDARPVFATAERFPGADEVVVAWPHVYLSEQIQAGALDERTVVCVLTHDMKFDVPLLSLALTHRRFAFIGAMGSRRTHQERRRRLIEAGVTEFELAALSSPIGLDLGARTPAETAVSIAAEIIAVRTGGTGERLRQRQGPIHAEPSRTQENEGERRERRSYVSR